MIRKREDHYHDIETLFYPLLFYDVLEIPETPDVKFHLTTTGICTDLNLIIYAHRCIV